MIREAENLPQQKRGKQPVPPPLFSLESFLSKLWDWKRLKRNRKEAEVSPPDTVICFFFACRQTKVLVRGARSPTLIESTSPGVPRLGLPSFLSCDRHPPPFEAKRFSSFLSAGQTCGNDGSLRETESHRTDCELDFI